MQKQRAYYLNGYQTKIKTTVTDCKIGKKGYEIVLEDSCFYPQGGGQASDKGTLAGQCVLDVQEREGILYHTVAQPLEIGRTVEGEIDWNYRFDLMQQHTGEHMISGVAYKKYGLHNVGFHMGKEYTTIDFDGKLSPEDVLYLEKKVNQGIMENRAIQIYYPTKQELEKMEYRSKKNLETDVRIVEIPEYDICACCGIHTKTTGEIGCVKILSADAYKNGVRLKMLAGNRALEDYRKKCENADKISHLLCVPANEIGAAVQKLKKEKEQLQWNVNHLEKEQLLQKAQGVNGEKAIFFETVSSIKALQHFANLLQERASFAAVFSGNDKKGYHFILVSKKWDMKRVMKKMQAIGVCQGGGTAKMVQGKIEANQKELRAFLEQSVLE